MKSLKKGSPRACYLEEGDLRRNALDGARGDKGKRGVEAGAIGDCGGKNDLE